MKKLQIKPANDIELVKKLRLEYGVSLAMVNDEYKKLIERQAQRCIIQFTKYNAKQNIILQGYEYIKKIFNFNVPLAEQNEGNEAQNQ